MDYLNLGDVIDYPTYNALVYLVRKFKRLTSDLRIASSIDSDYGTYTISSGLTSIGGNYILEDDVTITSNDVLKNCFYTFLFTVVDVNLSGEVNRRVVSVTGDTGDNGELEVVLDSDLLEDDEQILPDFKVDIVFDEHEYYTPTNNMNISLSATKYYVEANETSTITATVVDAEGDPVTGLKLGFNVNGTVTEKTLDSNGQASITYTGTGTTGRVDITVSSESIVLYDGTGVVEATVTGNDITLGYGAYQWLISDEDIVIDWGDGTTNTVNNPTTPLTHTYSDGLSSHRIAFVGRVTSLGKGCFVGCTGLTSVVIPNSVISLGEDCFGDCRSLTSVSIPNSVKSLGNNCFLECRSLTSVVIPDSVKSLGAQCFAGCTGLISVVIPHSVTNLGRGCFIACTNLMDYQLYWTGNSIIRYDIRKMQNNTNTLFIVPVGETSNYVSKGYPSTKIIERGDHLTLTADKDIIQSTETSTITAQLISDGRVATNKTLSYEIKHGSSTISTGTGTTDSNGEIDIIYTGTAVGQVDVVVSYGMLLQETFVIKDCIYYDGMTSDTTSNYYLNTTYNSIAYDGEYIVISSINGGSDCYVDLRGLNDSLKSKTVNFEVEVETNGLTGMLLRTYGLSPNVSVTVVDGVNVLENVVVPPDASNVYFRLNKASASSGASYKFKNIKIYPI